MARVPLVLVPGLLCDAAVWAHQIRRLADVADVEVAETRRDKSIAGIAKRVLESAPDRFALAGLSMGGYVAFEVMRQGAARVTRLALLDTSAAPDEPSRKRNREHLIRMAQAGRFRGVTPRLLPLFLHPDRLADAALTESVMAMTARVGRDAFLDQQRAIMARADSRPLLAAIRVPTLVLCGRQDALTPVARHVEIAAGIAGARLSIIEECGHLSTMERPQAVTVMLRDWLLRDA